jgi:hypothetical protein
MASLDRTGEVVTAGILLHRSGSREQCKYWQAWRYNLLEDARALASKYEAVGMRAEIRSGSEPAIHCRARDFCLLAKTRHLRAQ